MRLNPRKPRFLCLGLLTLLLMAQPLAASSKSFASEQMNGSRSFSAQEVTALVESLMDEADASIEAAYAEGYKAGVLEFAPEEAALQEVNSHLLSELERMETAHGKGLWTAGFIGAGAGVVVATLVCSLVFGMVH